MDVEVGGDTWSILVSITQPEPQEVVQDSGIFAELALNKLIVILLSAVNKVKTLNYSDEL